MVSNDVEALGIGDSCEALLLTPKARVIAPLVVLRRAMDDFLLLTDEGRDLVERLNGLRAQALARLTPDWTDKDLDALTARLARLNTDLAAHRALLDAQLETA